MKILCYTQVQVKIKWAFKCKKQKIKFKEFLFGLKLIRNSKKQIDEHRFGHFVFGMCLSVSTF